jgi:hypothetical protein
LLLCCHIVIKAHVDKISHLKKILTHNNPYHEAIKVLGLSEEGDGLGHTLHVHADSRARAGNAGGREGAGVGQSNEGDDESEHFSVIDLSICLISRLARGVRRNEITHFLVFVYSRLNRPFQLVSQQLQMSSKCLSSERFIVFVSSLVVLCVSCHFLSGALHFFSLFALLSRVFSLSLFFLLLFVSSPNQEIFSFNARTCIRYVGKIGYIVHLVNITRNCFAPLSHNCHSVTTAINR